MGDEFEISVARRVWMGLTEDVFESLEEFVAASLSWRLRLLMREEVTTLRTSIAVLTGPDVVRLRIYAEHLHKLAPEDYQSYTRDVAWYTSGALVRSLEAHIGENAYVAYHLVRTSILVNGHDWLALL